VAPDVESPQRRPGISDSVFRAVVGADRAALRAAAGSLVAIAMTLAIVAAILAGLGANPWSAGRALVSGALGNKFNFGQTAMIASLLILTGLAAAIPFSARLWNIGAEGQMYFGAFVAAGLGLTLPSTLPGWLFTTILVLASLAAGAVWGLVPGILKATINANEVIVSLMMTYIALQVADYGITVLWPQGASPETDYLPAPALLPNIWHGTLITAGAPLAVVAAVVAWVLMRRSGLGFQIRAIGLNPQASRLSGMHVGRVTVLAFAIGGAFAGLAGGINVLGMNGALVSGFSGNFGYLGIAVALVARLNPAWIVPAGLFFAILRVGSNGLQVQTGLSPDVGEIVVATFVILLLAFRVIKLRYAEAVGV
jgi:general nucleoside transport system permease protein